MPILEQTQKRNTIGVLISYVGDFVYPLYQGITHIAQLHDIEVIYFCLASFFTENYDFNNPAPLPANTLNLITHTNIDALIINTDLGDFVDKAAIETFIERQPQLPVASISIPFRGATHVSANNQKGIRDALVHLIEEHHSLRIAYISGPQNNIEAQIRHQTYLNTLQDYNLPIEADLFVEGDWFEHSGSAAITTLLDKRHSHFDAIVSANDSMLYGAVNALQQRGLQVPQDVKVVGFDNSRYALTASFTSVHQSFFDLGATAANALIQKISGKVVEEVISIDTKLIIRQSCGCLPDQTTNSLLPPSLLSNQPDTLQITTQLLAAHRNQLLNHLTAITSNQVAADLLDILEADIIAFTMGQSTTNHFTHTLLHIFQQIVNEGKSTYPWQQAIMQIRQDLLTQKLTPTLRHYLETTFHQIHLLIGSSIERLNQLNDVTQEQTFYNIARLGQRLMTSLNIDTIAQAIMAEFPKLGITHAYLALYEHPLTHPTDDATPYLICGYTDKIKLLATDKSIPFDSKSIQPSQQLSSQLRHDWAIMPLGSQKNAYGFIVIQLPKKLIHWRLCRPLQIYLNYALRNVYNTTAVQQATRISQEQAKRLTILNELIIGLSQAHSAKEAFKLVATKTRAITNTERVSAALYKNNRLELFALDGIEGLLPLNVSLPVEETMIGTVFTQKQSILLIDTSNHTWGDVQNLHKMGLQAALSVPLITSGEAIGTLNTATQDPQNYTADTQQILLQIASMLATTLNNQQLLEEALSAKETAEIANQAKSEFLSNMSHELRTPLNGILGYTQILIEDPSLQAQQKKGIGIIQQSGQHLLTLINDILDIAKIEARKLELIDAEINLLDFLSGVADMIQMRIRDKGGHFQYQATDDLPVAIITDAKRLRQVLLNLLSNAVKFTPNGIVTLQVSNRSIEAGPSDMAVLRFEVIDTGIGIAPHHINRIFKPFEQAQHQGTIVEGTGLGLAISQQIINAMGSQIQVESTLGEGSRFWFDLNLPITISPQNKKFTHTSPILGYQESTQRILVVDDKDHNRMMLRDALQPLGFEVVEATHGQQAIELVAKTSPHLILMDIIMPGISGIETVKRLRADHSLDDIPIIAASATIKETVKLSSIKAGCDDFITKPIVLKELLALLAEHLELTWLYENDPMLPQEKTAVQINGIKLPPTNTLHQLYGLAHLGDLTTFIEQLTTLANQDESLRPFVQKLTTLAKNFDDEGIINLLQIYRHTT